ncbi:MAG: cation diffusion facilitator family transporter [Bacteroidota bacterium]|nr:cation diffusion facilitator family transporter [Bacteroidota bacterium]
MIISLIVSIILLVVKFLAYFLTHSNAILTDAVESIVNVAAGSFALFGIYYASKPADEDHPYGHGKIEFFSSGFEGGMITIAGMGMMAKGVFAFFQKEEVHSLDLGIYLTLAAGSINYLVGFFIKKKGREGHSDLMIASGKHLISDAISSAGLVIGLALVYFTKIIWIDYAVAVLFGGYITFSGFRILKESVFNLLDQVDHDKIDHVISILNKNRRDNWIDIHNLRILKYGSVLHVDCHVTLPWYNNLQKTHDEIDAIEKLVSKESSHDIEFFIHADPCLQISCAICQVKNCLERKHEFVKKLTWGLDNVLPDRKHQL